MAIAPPPAPARPVRTRDEHPYRLTVAQYVRMCEHGIFRDKEPVFLWKGKLIAKMTKNNPHNYAITALAALLRQAVPEGWHIRQETSIAMGDDSMPEPDLMVIRGALTDYIDRPPTSRDIALIVEISDSTLAEDQGEVLEEYARRGIPVYWIVNIPGRRIEVYTDPSGPADAPTYRTSRTFGRDEPVPVVLDSREVGRIAVRDVVPWI